jgi:hypothetical protein
MLGAVLAAAGACPPAPQAVQLLDPQEPPEQPLPGTWDYFMQQDVEDLAGPSHQQQQQELEDALYGSDDCSELSSDGSDDDDERCEVAGSPADPQQAEMARVVFWNCDASAGLPPVTPTAQLPCLAPRAGPPVRSALKRRAAEGEGRGAAAAEAAARRVQFDQCLERVRVFDKRHPAGCLL